MRRVGRLLNDSPSDRGRSSLKQRTACWIPLVLAAALLPLALLGWQRWARGPSAAERAALRKLEIYDVRYELDENNRIDRLVLEGEYVTDDALDGVLAIPRLRNLSLHNSSVTDAGIAKLTALKSLQKLGITDTKVTDRGLKILEGMPSLQYVWLCESDRLTPRGIASLRRALPAVTVYVMNRPAPQASAQTAGGGPNRSA